MHRTALIMSLNPHCPYVTLSILQGARLLYCGCALCRIMQGTINKFASNAVTRTTRESSRLLGLGSTTDERWAEETGCNFWICWSLKKSPLPNAAGGSRAIVFTNSSEWWSVVLLTFVFPLPVIALSAVVSRVYTLPLRMPRRWCLHHSGPRTSCGWKCGGSACLNEGTGQPGL